MQVEHLENHTARLSVEVPAERLDKAMQAAARRISQQYSIPGFRKGKAPYAVVARYVGAQALMEEAIDKLGQEIYTEALLEAKIEPYAPGSLDEVKTEPNLTLVYSVPKQPTVELGDYREVRLPFETPAVEDSAVDETLRRMQDARAVVETVERPAQMGDVIRAQIFGEVVHPAHEHSHGDEEAEEETPPAEAATEDQPEQPQASAESEAQPAAETEHEDDHEHEPHVETIIDQETEILLSDEKNRDFIPGFAAQVMGANAGEQREFTLTFPEDYEDKQYAGHSFNFKLTVNEVKSRAVPDLNDDFAQQASEGKNATLLELRIQVRQDLEASAKRESEAVYADQVLEKVVELSSAQYPEEAVKEFSDEVLEELDRNLRERGLSLDQLKQIQKKDDDALRQEYRETAIQRLKRSFVIRELVAREELSVPEADLEKRIDALAGQFSTEPSQAASFRRMLNSAETRRNIATNMILELLRARLVAIARGENPPVGRPSLEMPVAEQQITLDLGGEAPAEPVTSSDQPAAETSTPGEAEESGEQSAQ